MIIYDKEKDKRLSLSLSLAREFRVTSDKYYDAPYFSVIFRLSSSNQMIILIYRLPQFAIRTELSSNLFSLKNKIVPFLIFTTKTQGGTLTRIEDDVEK